MRTHKLGISLAPGLHHLSCLLTVQEKLGGTQTHFRSIVMDDYLRVIGTDGTVFSMGDAATIAQVLLVSSTLLG